MKRYGLKTILVMLSVLALVAGCSQGPKMGGEQQKLLSEAVMEFQTFQVDGNGMIVCGAKDSKAPCYQYRVKATDLDPTSIEFIGDNAIKIWTRDRQTTVLQKDLYNRKSWNDAYLIINATKRDSRPQMAQALQDIIFLHTEGKTAPRTVEAGGAKAQDPQM